MAYQGKKPNAKYQRPPTTTKMTFFSGGTPYEFSSHWLINIDNTRITLLELHKQLVLSANSPSCFILDGLGNKVNCRV
jgi:hypothetical protein